MRRKFYVKYYITGQAAAAGINRSESAFYVWPAVPSASAFAAENLPAVMRRQADVVSVYLL